MSEVIKDYIRNVFIEMYQDHIDDATLSVGVAADEGFETAMKSMSENELLKVYRNLLEREAIGTLISEYLSGKDSREAFQELVRGSVLGDMLDEIYAAWDREIGKDELLDCYADTADIAEMVEVEFSDVMDSEDEEDDSDDGDLSFLKDLIESTGGLDDKDRVEDTAAYQRLVEMIEETDDEDRDEYTGKVLNNIDDFPFH